MHNSYTNVALGVAPLIDTGFLFQKKTNSVLNAVLSIWREFFFDIIRDIKPYSFEPLAKKGKKAVADPGPQQECVCLCWYNKFNW